jgi:hypothetical protein
MFKAEEEGRKKRGPEDSYAIESGQQGQDQQGFHGPFGCSVRLPALLRGTS